MSSDLLAGLESWKRSFGTADPAQLERLLEDIAGYSFSDAGSLIRLHEDLLFLRAYPATPGVARLADQILYRFAARVEALRADGRDLTPFEESEVSGIAGTCFSAVFSYAAARSISMRRPGNFDINWDAWDTDNLGSLLRRFVPLMDEDWPVEAHVPYRAWFDAGRKRGQTDLAWLLNGIGKLPLLSREQAELYDSLRVPLLWDLGADPASRSCLRLPGSSRFFHREPLIRRSEVSLRRELDSPPLPVNRVPRKDAGRILELIVDTSAMRYRELYGFNHPEKAGMIRAELGRGVEVFFFGVPPEWRLPLRAYHAGMFFKNGVPAGYIETLSLFERSEIGFNLYYTFREGESAWLYVRLLKLVHQLLGTTCFSVDPYQIGRDNPEAIESGAFWFYRKLGFRPLDPQVRRVLALEEKRMFRDPGHRSSRKTLQRLADGYILWDGNGDHPGDWDRFRVRDIGLAAHRRGSCDGSGFESMLKLIPGLDRWSQSERDGISTIMEAKQSSQDEARYLRLTQGHPRLRAAVVKLGSGIPSGSG